MPESVHVDHLDHLRAVDELMREFEDYLLDTVKEDEQREKLRAYVTRAYELGRAGAEE